MEFELRGAGGGEEDDGWKDKQLSWLLLHFYNPTS